MPEGRPTPRENGEGFPQEQGGAALSLKLAAYVYGGPGKRGERIATVLIDTMTAEANEIPLAEVARKHKIKQSTVLYHKRRFYGCLRNAVRLMNVKVRPSRQREDEEVEGAWD